MITSWANIDIAVQTMQLVTLYFILKQCRNTFFEIKQIK